jgi:hypothetical protein
VGRRVSFSPSREPLLTLRIALRVAGFGDYPNGRRGHLIGLPCVRFAVL